MFSGVKKAGLFIAVLLISCYGLRAQGLGFYGAGFASNYYFKEDHTFHNGAGFGGYFTVPAAFLDMGLDFQYLKRTRRENDVLVTYCPECIRYEVPPQWAPVSPAYTSLTDQVFISNIYSLKGILDFPVTTKDSFKLNLGPRVGINCLRQAWRYTNEVIPEEPSDIGFTPSIGVESSLYWTTFNNQKTTWFLKPGADVVITGDWQGLTDISPPFSEVPITVVVYVKAGLFFGQP